MTELHPIPSDHTRWMSLAIEQAQKAIVAGQSPFGSVIVREGRLIAATHNTVWMTTDPTAHAEVVCLRAAALALGSIDLTGCELYSTTEPCPMCAAAIHWARIDKVYCGATIADAQKAGFNELTIPIEEMYTKGGSTVQIQRGVLADRCAALFDAWRGAGGRRY